jgi:sugar lactone lactonase YvrE
MGANAIAITPKGKSLYIAVASVWQYSINPNTGKLTPKSPATVPAPGNAHDIAIAPDGKNAYVVTVANNTVSQYHINPRTGALTSKPVSTARTALHPEAIKLAPDEYAARGIGLRAPPSCRSAGASLRTRVARASSLAADDDNDPRAPGIRRPGLG